MGMQIGKKGVFFVSITPPLGISTAQREFISQLVLHAASQFTFLGMEDWTVELGSGSRVLGVAEEFHDLSGSVVPQDFIVYFGRLIDAKKFCTLFKTIFSDAKVSAPRKQRQQDWMRAWRKHYKPVSVANGALWIYPAWIKVPVSRRKNAIRIYPGQAFGTGTHETTMLCLEALLKERKIREVQKVLDFGAGTGILALSAMKLNSKLRASAVEVDATACEQLRKNARINRMKLPVGRKLASTKKHDLVFANVLAPVLLMFKKDLLARVRSGGVLILSGILASEVEKFIQEFIRDTAVSKADVRMETRGDWAAVVVEVS